MFGGGYAMYPLLEREVVERRRWLAESEMQDIFALSQVIPGLIGINSSMLVGQRRRGWRGALAAVLGMVAVPFVVILSVAGVYDAVISNIWVERFTEGLRPAVAGLLLGTGIKLAQKSFRQFWSVSVGVVVIAAAVMLKVSPVHVILGTIVVALLLHWMLAIRAGREVAS